MYAANCGYTWTFAKMALKDMRLLGKVLRLKIWKQALWLLESMYYSRLYTMPYPCPPTVDEEATLLHLRPICCFIALQLKSIILTGYKTMSDRHHFGQSTHRIELLAASSASLLHSKRIIAKPIKSRDALRWRMSPPTHALCLKEGSTRSPRNAKDVSFGKADRRGHTITGLHRDDNRRDGTSVRT